MLSNLHMKFSLGSGSFGDVFEAQTNDRKEEVAVKVFHSDKTLDTEKQVYEAIGEATGFPHYYGEYNQQDSHGIVIELFGKSLDKLFDEMQNRFSLKTVLMLADQMISRLEYLHSKNIIHRDIKPSNFSVGLGARSNVIYLYDFGLSEVLSNGKKHEGQPTAFAGTARYSSIAAQKGSAPSKRDDLESLGYILLFFLKGKLPWATIGDSHAECRFQSILAAKVATPLSELCLGLPDEFSHFLAKARSLGSNETPQYSEYRLMFRNLFISKGYVYDNIYDWQEMKNKSFMFRHPRIHSFEPQPQKKPGEKFKRINKGIAPNRINNPCPTNSNMKRLVIANRK